jgi:hypothetical protein
MSRRQGRNPTPVQEVDLAVFAQYADISELLATGLLRLCAAARAPEAPCVLRPPPTSC